MWIDVRCESKVDRQYIYSLIWKRVHYINTILTWVWHCGVVNYYKNEMKQFGVKKERNMNLNIWYIFFTFLFICLYYSRGLHRKCWDFGHFPVRICGLPKPNYGTMTHLVFIDDDMILFNMDLCHYWFLWNFSDIFCFYYSYYLIHIQSHFWILSSQTRP